MMANVSIEMEKWFDEAFDFKTILENHYGVFLDMRFVRSAVIHVIFGTFSIFLSYVNDS